VPRATEATANYSRKEASIGKSPQVIQEDMRQVPKTEIHSLYLWLFEGSQKSRGCAVT
jgi:hypothetical protein